MQRRVFRFRSAMRLLAVLAWLSLGSQVVGLPIHLAVEEHHHEAHGSAHGADARSHVHFGRFGHSADPHHAPGAPDSAPLPPHSAFDHLIDSALPRAAERGPVVELALLPPPTLLLNPPVTEHPFQDRFVGFPHKPPPRRPEQSRAPPAFRS